MQQKIHLMNFLWLPHLEVTLQEFHHCIDRLTPLVTLSSNKYRVTTADFERNNFHEAAHLTALAPLTAQIKRRSIFLAQFLGPLHDHGSNTGMDPALVMDHGLLLKYHIAIVPFCCSLLYYKTPPKSSKSNN